MILVKSTKHLSRLYESESCRNEKQLDTFFEGISFPTLGDDARKQLDEQITASEIEEAIKTMQAGKSPGPDGFPVEFYRTFSKNLTPVLKEMYDESLRSSSLPLTLNEATISLLLKPNKDPLEPSSYRPISLLNVDFQILSKCLARRLEKQLPTIISQDQTGFIKGRHVFFNIRRLFQILYTPSAPQPEIVLSLDAEKAFDRVEWDYLCYTLAKFGLGEHYISWIKLLYSSPMAQVQTNKEKSNYFPLHRGTRQGCPLSPLLFAVAIEPLAVKLRSEAQFKGVFRAGEEHKLSLYADDLLLYISDPLGSLYVFSILNSFGKISGYKLNLQKSELLPINKIAKTLPFQNFSLGQTSEYITYLGVQIPQLHNKLFDLNLTNLLETVKKDLKRWNTLPLSLAGRINAVKMNVLPKCLYLFQCVPILIRRTFFVALDKSISTFIWNNKPSRIRKAFLQRPKQSGGMALPNFEYYYWCYELRHLGCRTQLHDPGDRGKIFVRYFIFQIQQ